MSYETVKKVAQIWHGVGAILLFVTSILKIAQFNINQAIDYIMTAYYILFGILIVLIEFGVPKVLQVFYFMNFSFGKALSCAFIATMTFNLHDTMQLITTIFFFIAALGFLIIGFCFCGKEAEEAAKNAPQSAGESPAPAAATSDGKGQPEMHNDLPAPQV